MDRKYLSPNFYNSLYDIKNAIDVIDDKNYTDIERFLSYCYKNLSTTNSQNFQDLWANFEIYSKNPPYNKNSWFVDIGAADPIKCNNTFLLEKSGYWKGIVVEPNPVWHRTLELNRSLSTRIIRKAVTRISYEKVKFKSTNNDHMLSTVSGYGKDDEHAQKRNGNFDEIEVETISMRDLFVQYCPPVIDYLSLDTEGSEYDILESYFSSDGPNRFTIECISVEHNYTPDRDKIYVLMTKNGYQRKFETISRWDDFYVRRIH